ncbi:hypothetical protein [Comamonas humi]
MSTLMEEEIKRWTAKRKTALVLEIIQRRRVLGRSALLPALAGRFQRSPLRCAATSLCQHGVFLTPQQCTEKSPPKWA